MFQYELKTYRRQASDTSQSQGLATPRAGSLVETATFEAESDEAAKTEAGRRLRELPATDFLALHDPHGAQIWLGESPEAEAGEAAGEPESHCA